jgi:hypothetical protein
LTKIERATANFWTPNLSDRQPDIVGMKMNGAEFIEQMKKKLRP